jgi:hypothetical protein
MCENAESTETSNNWWDTPDGTARIRQDCLRHLILGLEEADVHRALVDSKLGSACSGLLLGIAGLRDELLAWAKGQLQ